jgi:hypothetical protein
MYNVSHSRWGFLVVGLVVGTIIGLNLQGLWPSMPLHASATHGQDNFAIATGFVDEEIEAIYFLDFLTGDMKAAVLALRGPRMGKFNALFEYNILQDFQAGEDKSPKYLIVTGEANIPRGRANFQFAKSVVYVAEATTGQIACYTIPWSSTAQAAGQFFKAQFVPLDKMKFRTAIIRGE